MLSNLVKPKTSLLLEIVVPSLGHLVDHLLVEEAAGASVVECLGIEEGLVEVLVQVVDVFVETAQPRHVFFVLARN